MIINGIPALACSAFADEKVKNGELILEPLSKFPVVADLIVDRSIIYENLIRAKAYLDSLAVSDKRQHEQQYSVAKCLKCGLCLEVCPNYYPGEDFYGAVLANESYLIASQSAEKPAQLVKEYKTHFGAGCSKALSCVDVCPMELQPLYFWKYANDENWQGMLDRKVMDCVECRCCEFICSSKIPLVTKIKAGKAAVRGMK